MKDQPHRNTILFDLDGTLLDQTATILKCHQFVQKFYGFPPMTTDDVKYSLGADLQVTLEKHLSPELAPEACLTFRKYYEEIMHTEDFDIIPGTHWILENLKNANYTLAIFTNKPGPYARHILEKTDLHHYFHTIFGKDDTPYHKPQPEFTHHALSELKSCPNTAILIGDSTYDVDAAASVNLPIYAVTTGSHSKEYFLSYHTKPNGIFTHLFDLGHHLFGFPLPESFTPPKPLNLAALS